MHVNHIAVNLSSLQLKQPDFVASVRNILERYTVDGDPIKLELELTESSLMPDMDGTVHSLNELRKLGVLLSIDDFGSGYSWLNYLKHLPIDRLKIDPSFICSLPDNRVDVAIVNAIVALAHGLGLNVIAEGVETSAQLDYLRNIGCDEVQGFLVNRPVPVDEMTRLLLDGAELNLFTGA